MTHVKDDPKAAASELLVALMQSLGELCEQSEQIGFSSLVFSANVAGRFGVLSRCDGFSNGNR